MGQKWSESSQTPGFGTADRERDVRWDGIKVPRRCSLRRRHRRSPTLPEKIAADTKAFLVARSCCRKHMVACPTRLAVDGVMRRAVAMYPIVRDVSFTRNVASLKTLFCG